MSTGAYLMAHTSMVTSQSGGAADEGHFGSWNPARRPEKAVSDPSKSLPTTMPTHHSLPRESESVQQDGTSPAADASQSSSGEEFDPSYATPASLPGVSERQAIVESEEPKAGSEPGRTTPDPFAQLDFSARTNSFPEEEFFDNTSTTTPQPDGLRGGEAGVAHQPTTDNGDGPLQNSVESMPTKATRVSGHEDDGYSFFDHMNAQTKPIYNPPETESRFEEGVPLVNNTDVSSPANTRGRGSLDDLFRQDESPEEAGFFNSTQGAEPTKVPTLQRKSTSQVLESLNIHDDSTVADSPAEIPTWSSAAIPEEEAPEENLEEKWKAVLDDDDFLMDDDDGELLSEASSDAAPDHATRHSAEHVSSQNFQQTEPQQPSASPHHRDTAQFGQPRMNPYTPHQPSSTDLVSGLRSVPYAQPVPPQIPENSAEKPVSFSNQSKAGYQSPYDLPMDIRPKRNRAAPHPVSLNPPPAQPASSMPPPPPRSSSMSGTRPMSSSSAVPPPPVGSAPRVADPAPRVLEKPSGGSGNFFEDLPVSSRSRPSTRGRYTPQPAASYTPEAAGVDSYSPPQQPTSSFDTSHVQKSESMDPHSALPVPAPTAVPGQPSRYSPKPPSAQSGQTPSRYSPAPTLQSGGSNKYISPPPNLPFQPRTSSPLAQQGRNTNSELSQPGVVDGSDPGLQNSFQSSSPYVPNDGKTQHMAPESKRMGYPPTNPYLPGQPPSSQSAAPEHLDPGSHRLQQIGEDTTSVYGPMSQSAPESQIVPPKRSMTQSPGKPVYGFNHTTVSHEAIQRPASVHGTGPPPPIGARVTSQPTTRRPNDTPQLDIIPPTDGQERDPLERWKGAPIFKFGFGGITLTTRPKYIPRYTPGHTAPQLKPNPGDIKTVQSGENSDATGSAPKFPGPLRSKSKKKDVLNWLSAMIAIFEDELRSGAVYPGQTQQHEEKLLLWKIIRIMVEHDGVIEGSPEVEENIRSLLSPAGPSQVDGPGMNPPSSTAVEADSRSPGGLERIRNNLLTGNREKAVWEAVDHRLWGHAMLLSSTLDKSVWKQVSQEFIRREVRSIGQDTESLAALYEILAGNVEESIDELVPVSARAGLQMVSKNTGAGPTKNALDGLNKWRETLSLVLSNRSPQHHHALLALSRLLASYGRVEASHICALFARSGATSVFGGIRDPQSTIALLGADHHHYPSTFMHDRNSVLLTEVYEFSTSVLAGSPASVLPHLQSFKLQHARLLAEEGHASEAHQYCDSIGAILKATSKPSPYYHQTFCAELDELSNRLRQVPGDGSSSWISKPSMEKVSGSVWAKFNSFVTGDESDGGSTGSAMGVETDSGPFAKMVGTPPISRSPSLADGYFIPSHQQGAGVPSTSRYTPGNQQSSPDQHRGRRSLDSQRSSSTGPVGRGYSQRRQSHDPPTLDYPTSSSAIYGFPAGQPPQHSHPLAPVEEAYSPQSASVSGDTAVLSKDSLAGNPYQPAYVPPQQAVPAQGYGFTPPAESGYEPPSATTGYEPPSQQAETPESDHDEEGKPAKSSYMADDEDDEISANAERIRQAEREKINRETSEAVRKAAEEDAKKDASAEKPSWFSWLRGGKKEQGNAPIRAKLGEQNSFYYDQELKRWVNKKDPDSTQSVAQATPPPPKASAPSSRSVSGDTRPPTSGGSPVPPPGPAGNRFLAPPRDSSPHPSSSPGGSPQLIPRSVSGGADSRPTSRPGPPLSNASSIDDLLGAPQARKGNSAKARKKGRGYVDVMAK